MSKNFVVRINKGAEIWQDRISGNWPQCLPLKSEYSDNPEDYEYKTKYPNALFIAENKDDYWDCRRNGYGAMKSNSIKGEYGNGSIFVSGENCVEIIGKNYTEI